MYKPKFYKKMTIKEQLLTDIIKLSNPKLLHHLYVVFQEIIQKEFVETREESQFVSPFKDWKGSFQVKTVKEVLSPSYVYKPLDKTKLVGCWEGEETIDELLILVK